MVFSCRSKSKAKKNTTTSPQGLLASPRRAKEKAAPAAAAASPIPISLGLLEPPTRSGFASSGSASPSPFSGSPLLTGKSPLRLPADSPATSCSPPRHLPLHPQANAPSWCINGQPALRAEEGGVSASPLPSPWVEEAMINTEFGFSAHQLQTLKEAFDFFDIDRDGRITSPELQSVFKFLGSPVTEGEVELMISDADIDGNGTVELNEFLRMMRRYYHKHEAPSTEEEEMLEAFKAFDHNGDCYIDFDEIKKTMHFLGEAVSDEEVKAMISEADVDKDGRINFEGDALKKHFARVPCPTLSRLV